MEKKSTLLLTDLEYAHIIDNNTGEVRLVEGPHRGVLEAHEEIVLTNEKIILKDGQYAIILNPINAGKNEIQYGDREVRIGPQRFPLYPGEKIDKTPQIGLETAKTYKKDGVKYDEDDEEFDDETEYFKADESFDGIRWEYVLKHNKGLLVKAMKDFAEDDGETHKAGDEWIVEGPRQYIPHKYALIKRKVKAISLGHYEGIYVKNIESGEIRLEEGPKVVMLSPNEERWDKQYTQSELDAMKIKGAARTEYWRAHPMWILENEIAMIMSEETRAIKKGPQVVLLDPFQRPYVLTISGGTPKGSDTLKIWRVKIGPNFSTDELVVRTKDNAVIVIRVRYKWRFIVDPNDEEKVFAVSDFIGLMTETIGSIIRAEAAKHDFEDLHAKAVEIIKTAVFGDKESYVFKENSLEVFGIDIKRVLPEDDEIADKLTEAIKSNMEVFVKKIQQSAQLEAEQQLIEGKKKIEEKRKELITIEIENLRTENVEKAKITQQAEEIEAYSSASKIRIESEAKIAATSKEITDLITALSTGGGELFLKHEQIKALGSISKIAVIPSDSKMFLPMGEFLKNLR